MAAVQEDIGGADINASITRYAIYFSAIAVGVWVFGALQVNTHHYYFINTRLSVQKYKR